MKDCLEHKQVDLARIIQAGTLQLDLMKIQSSL